MLPRFISAGALGAAALLCPLTARAQAVTFHDGTFNLSDYSESTIFKSDPASSLTFDQCATCGNPDEALRLVLTFANPSTLAIGFVNTTFAYDPLTQGTIDFISASIDKNVKTEASGTLTTSFRPLIFQNLTYYLGVIPGPTFSAPVSSDYFNLSNPALTEASFLQFDFTTAQFGSGHPDFAGGPMEFGLAQISGLTPAVLETDYDNLNFAVTTVPEPSTLETFGLGLVGLVGAVHRRRRAV